MSSENPIEPADVPTRPIRPNQPGSRGYGEYDSDGVWRPRFGQMTSEVTKTEFEAKAAKEAKEKEKRRAAQAAQPQTPSPSWPWGGQGPADPNRPADPNQSTTQTGDQPAAPGGINAPGGVNGPGNSGPGTTGPGTNAPGGQTPPHYSQPGATPPGAPRPTSPWMSGQRAEPNPQDGRICPPQLRIASWIWIIFGIWTMLGAIWLAQAPDMLDSLVGSQLDTVLQDTGIDRSEYLSMVVKTTVVLSVLIAIVMVVAAIFVRKGKNWARIMGIAVSVFGVLAGITAGPFGLILMMMLGVSIYVSITPPATNFIRARKAAKHQ